MGKSQKGVPQVLNLEKVGVTFNYPADWSLGDQNEKCNIVYMKNFAPFNINRFKLPQSGLSLEEFVSRIKSKTNPTYKVTKDFGVKNVNGKNTGITI